MTDVRRQTEHERKVEEELEDQTGEPITPQPGGSVNRYTGNAGQEDYEAEIEAERWPDQERRRDEDPTDAGPPAYKPRTG